MLKSKVKIKHCMILILILFISLAALLFISLRHDPYAELTKINKDTKKIGEIMHQQEQKEDTYYLSLYYPKTNYTLLDDAINNYIAQYKKELNTHKDMLVYTLDYDIQNIFDHYVSLTFHKKIYDKQKQLKSSEDTSFNYDIKQNKLLTVDDVLRRNYLHHLKEVASKQKISFDIKKDTLQSFIIRENELVFYFQNDISKSLTLPYKQHQAYIKLQDKQIPSYFQGELAKSNQQMIDPNKKMIALTFDDGPHPENTKAIMDAIESYGGRSTFFMLGQNVRRYPNIVKKVYSRGHEVANHSWDHSFRLSASLSNPMNQQEVLDELYNTNDEIYKLIGIEPTLFRPPFGAINQTLREACEMPMVLWDVDSRDWETHNPKSIHDTILESVKNGGQVILLHDIHKDTVSGVISVLKELHDQGYQFVSVSTLLKYKEKELTQTNKNPIHNVVVTPLTQS